MKIIREFSPDEPIVEMITFRDRVLVATIARVFMYDPATHQFHCIRFVEEDCNEPNVR